MKFLENEFKGDYKLIIDYLIDYASKDNAFKEKLDNSDQTAKDLESYIREEAQKLASNNMSMVKDDVVFGWAIHFIDENIKQTKEKPKKVKKAELEEIDTEEDFEDFEEVNVIEETVEVKPAPKVETKTKPTTKEKVEKAQNQANKVSLFDLYSLTNE